MTNPSYHKLISKIDAFIRKYYTNMLIKGLLISLGIVISFFLLLDILEHFFHLRTLFRAILFYLFLVITGGVIFYWILVPLAKLISFGKRISHEQAAKIIGEHFPEVSDSLLNTLQLNKLSEEESTNKNILLASIEQRAEKLSPIPFQSAVNFSINKKYLKYTLPPLIILIALLLYSPHVITEPSQRLINYDVKYEEQAPYHFEIKNEKLEVVEDSDFELHFRAEGDIVPEEVYVVIEGYPFKAKKEDARNFSYVFKNLRKSKGFYFQAGKYSFEEHIIKVLPKPMIVGFEVSLHYPKYTGKKNEILENTGDFSVPEGTKIEWHFHTRDTRKMKLLWDREVVELAQVDAENFIYKRRVRHSAGYALISQNDYVVSPDTLNYKLDVIPDAYPLIRVEEFEDSTNINLLYFKGFIKDDYGFTKLQFVYEIKKAEQEDSALIKKFKLDIDPQRQKQDFYHFLDLATLNLKPGDELTYYFRVWDNDRINGAKSSKSRILSYRVPSPEELARQKEERARDLQNKLDETRERAQKINKEMDRLSKKLAEKKNLDWQDKQALKNLLEQYNDLLKDLEKIQKQNKEKQIQDQQFTEEDERIIEKQKQLNELMDKLMTPEMKEMMEEMRKMMEEEMKKEDAQDMLEKLKIENKDIEKQLDRDLEIFKQMEFDMKLQDAIDQLKELQKKQEQLSEKSQEKKADSEELKKEQEKLNEEFKQFEKKMEEAKKANEELERPNKMEDTKEEQEQIKQQQQKSSEQLSKGKNKSASKMQKEASESMKKLEEKLEQMQADMEMESMGEDMESLREILANLIESSFNQEALMQEVKYTSNSDPKYPQLIHRQKQIRDDMQMVEDSLFALSKRQPAIAPVVNKEVSKINSGIDQSLRAMLDLNTIGPTTRRQKDQAVAKQQYAMTSMNNLALMLSEALEQMKKQMQNQKAGNKACNKPKSGKGGQSIKDIRKMQQALNKKMQEMKKRMQEGKNQGPKKGNNNQGGEKMSEEMARMAAEQEAIRQKLQQYQQQLKKEGRGKEAQALNGVTKKMEENETDLVNKILRAESLKRQQEIETRLLEAEEAERKQGEDKKRKSEEGKNFNNASNVQFFDYIRKRNQEVELLKTIPPRLKPFYKNKVDKYFEKMGEENHSN
jgi:hypothetical protein